MLIVYKTDAWHNHNSKLLLGVADDFNNAQNIIIHQARDENEKLSEYTLRTLREINQTQDYEGEGEFMIENITKNILL
jgi:hypothetical protein